MEEEKRIIGKSGVVSAGKPGCCLASKY